MIEQLRRRLMVGFAIGIVVVVGIVVVTDASALTRAFRDFDWRLVPLILALTLFNYTLRFVKWQYYLRILSIGPIRRRDSLLIFVSGFTMAMTPGKVGELLKSYLLRTKTATAISTSAPVIVAERVTDSLALLALAGVGLIAFRDGWQLLVVSGVVLIVAIALVQHEPSMRRALRRVGGLRPMRQRGAALEEMYTSTRRLLGPRPFVIGTAIGVASWFGECLAFYLILIGLGFDHSGRLLIAATFVFAASAWIGGLSLLPGGLIAAEASVAGLLLLTVNDPQMTPSVAATATLLIRFATLWFGVLLGVCALSRVASWKSDPTSEDGDVRVRTELEAMVVASE